MQLKPLHEIALYKQKAQIWFVQEGQRPSQIISPQLEVGDHLQRGASGGKTNVTINGREITKEELRILKVGWFFFFFLDTFILIIHKS